MSKAAVIEHSPLRRLWLKWRFHLNILLLLIPLGLMPKYLHEASMNRGEIGLGERELGELKAGKWSVQIAERFDEAPRSDGPAGYFKQFKIALCSTCTDIKAVYLRVGKPRSLRAAGALFSGTPYRMTGVVNIPVKTSPDADLWLTFEGWDGSMQQVSIPLSKASPATVAWLKQQGGKS
ncbi:thiamine pyrophosphate-binding protein [Pseudomonas sp. H9]|uniref:thiamine pyrophosphate-binding protein n=1 Tax=Pseudomonas sp. H9 TaxID=483968 RepID=UPI001057C308|nr:thiamine pyrophosphate-binding protein [Pseudomonas sp. H9]TDF82588.1 thiamine pyrophosphate-binding protein [Pseudomonas sp. H9]